MRRLTLTSVLALLALATPACAQKSDEEARYGTARALLVRSIGDYAATIGEPADPRVLKAMGAVPRHLFVPPGLRGEAYNDYPLSIGEGQTISQPSLVALMTHLLRPKPGDVILEVGTGSGYQAAILSSLVARVYSIEIVEPLAREANGRLEDLGYSNVTVRQGDGYAGWPAYAPFDGIIVTAGAERIPAPLLAQLKPGGRMVIPLGPSDDQQLVLVAKGSEGRVSQEVLLPVRFVPFTRETERRN